MATRTIDISSFLPIQSNEPMPVSPSNGALDYKAEKERRAKIRKIQNERKRLQVFLEQSSEELCLLEEKIQNPEIQSNYTLLSELYSKKENLEEEMLEAMTTLESLEDFITT